MDCDPKLLPSSAGGASVLAGSDPRGGEASVSQVRKKLGARAADDVRNNAHGDVVFFCFREINFPVGKVCLEVAEQNLPMPLHTVRRG